MSLIKYNMDDVPDLKTVEPGEYTMVCESAEETESKSSGAPMIAMRFSIEGEPTAFDVYYYRVLPTEDDDEKKAQGKLRQLKAMCQAISVTNPSAFGVDELIGLSGVAILGEEEGDDGQMRNVIKRWVVPE